MSTAAEPHSELNRSIGFWQMTLYGAGSMLGAGIYGLIGKAAGEMGSAVWLAFVAAMVAALLTGLSYASLGSRYPRAGGAAFVTQRAWSRGLLTHMVGLAVACSGFTSIAAGARVIGENLQALPALEAVPVLGLTLAFLAVLALIVYRGIRESMWANVLCTLVEAGGLFLVIVVGLRYWGTANLLETPVSPAGAGIEAIPLLLVVQGAVLTFYSFIGFEDTLNVAEEVKNPRRTLPMALVLAMLISCALYVGVAITAVSVVPWRELAEANAPLAEVMRRAAPWFPTGAFVGITIFAVANTGLINFVTASRLLYGMARDGRLPAPLARVHLTRRTPHVAIAVILAILVALALAGDISQLASATVLLLLGVFVIVNSSLVVLRLRPGEPKGGFEVPIVVPALGAIVCLVLLVVRVASGEARAPIIAAVLLAVVASLYVLIRPKAAEA